MQKEEAHKLLSDTTARLGEHFEVTAIIVSTVIDGETKLFYFCSGNVYALQGMLQEVIGRIENHISGNDESKDEDDEEEEEEEEEAY